MNAKLCPLKSRGASARTHFASGEISTFSILKYFLISVKWQLEGAVILEAAE